MTLFFQCMLLPALIVFVDALNRLGRAFERERTPARGWWRTLARWALEPNELDVELDVERGRLPPCEK